MAKKPNPDKAYLLTFIKLMRETADNEIPIVRDSRSIDAKCEIVSILWLAFAEAEKIAEAL